MIDYLKKNTNSEDEINIKFLSTLSKIERPKSEIVGGNRHKTIIKQIKTKNAET